MLLVLAMMKRARGEWAFVAAIRWRVPSRLTFQIRSVSGVRKIAAKWMIAETPSTADASDAGARRSKLLGT